MTIFVYKNNDPFPNFLFFKNFLQNFGWQIISDKSKNRENFCNRKFEFLMKDCGVVRLVEMKAQEHPS